MNTKVWQLVRAAVLTAFLALNHTASAFYDTHVGRWISRDPIGESGGNNIYGFVKNSSISFSDPQGLLTFSVTYHLNEQNMPLTSDGRKSTGYVVPHFDKANIAEMSIPMVGCTVYYIGKI